MMPPHEDAEGHMSTRPIRHTRPKYSNMYVTIKLCTNVFHHVRTFSDKYRDASPKRRDAHTKTREAPQRHPPPPPQKSGYICPCTVVVIN